MNEKQYPSRDLTYEWGRMAPERLAEEATAIDSKTITVLSAASVIVAVAASLHGEIPFNASIIPFLIALLVFFIILAKSVWSLSAQWFHVADSPTILREDYWILEQEEAKEKYWEWVEKDFEDNYRAVMLKGKVLVWVIPLLGVETISLVAWLFLV